MSETDKNQKSQAALLRILQTTLKHSAQVTFYASALGAIALMVSSGAVTAVPVLATLAGGIGVNALSDILGRIAKGESVEDQEIEQVVRQAINDSGIEQLLTQTDFQIGISRLLREQRHLRFAIQHQEVAIAERLIGEYKRHTVILVELKDEFREFHDDISVHLDDLSGDTQTIISLLKQVLNLIDLLQKAPSQEEMIQQLHNANSQLRDYAPSDIPGVQISIEREEVKQIFEWINSKDSSGKVLMVTDQPGGGKTVVLRDVLKRLESEHIPVLAIKSDYLSGIRTYDDLSARLRLEFAIEGCVRRFSGEGIFVIIIDQLDALSFGLSRDQSTLDIIFGLIITLRNIPNVRIIASCRTFDLKNDPRLSKIEPDTSIQPKPFTQAQVNLVLEALGINPDMLLPVHKTLLSIPLHLRVYAEIVTDEPNTEPFYTLQELYDKLWKLKIETPRPGISNHGSLIDAIYRLVDAMQQRREPSVPIGTLDSYIEAAVYLKREGIIREEKRTLLFFHQTFFDYCYARRFIAVGKSLYTELINSPQGLFERSKLIHVIAFLRVSDKQMYAREMQALLFGEDLRVHLRLMLIGWLGNLYDPSQIEINIIHKMKTDLPTLEHFLNASSGNINWFAGLKDIVVIPFLRSGDDPSADLAIRYLSTFVHSQLDTVIEILKPYLGMNDSWDNRIIYCLRRISDWKDGAKTKDFLIGLIQRGKLSETSWLKFMFGEMARTNPCFGCEILRIHLDYQLDTTLTKDWQRIDYLQWGEDLLAHYDVGILIEQAVIRCPDVLLNQIFPWFIRTIAVFIEPKGADYLAIDALFHGSWYMQHSRDNRFNFAVSMAAVLSQYAKTQPHTFREIARAFAESEAFTLHRVLILGYLASPELYIDDIVLYLTGDSRRLDVGENLYDSRHEACRLYQTVIQYGSQAQQRTLEDFVLGLETSERENHWDFVQFRYLKLHSHETLSDEALKRLVVLEQKFGTDFSPSSGFISARAVRSPISQFDLETKSDDDLIRAMQRYGDDTEHGHPDDEFGMGGIIELSRAFREYAKKDPTRCYRIINQSYQAIASRYISEVLSGLAEAENTAELGFDLFRVTHHKLSGETRREVMWALHKFVPVGIPDDILETVTDWALNDPDPERDWELSNERSSPVRDIAHEQAINSVRGVAVEFIGRASRHLKPPQIERAFTLIDTMSNDATMAVRVSCIKVLSDLLSHDAERSLKIFLQMLSDKPDLVESVITQEFIRLNLNKNFATMESLIVSMLSHTNAHTRQAGARLAALATFGHSQATVLVDKALKGDTLMRQGVVYIYAYNLPYRSWHHFCSEKLLPLLNDPDEEVRQQLGVFLYELKVDALPALSNFLFEFVNSLSLVPNANHLFDYLFEASSVYEVSFKLGVEATEKLLEQTGTELVDIRTALAIAEDKVVRLILNIYNRTDDLDLKSRAMDCFERLLLLNSRIASGALKDWDAGWVTM